MHLNPRAAMFAPVIILVACGKGIENDTEGKPPIRDSVAPSASSPAASVTAAPAPWTVDYRGIGPIRIGMTLAEATAELPGFAVDGGAAEMGCAYAQTKALPAGVSIMVDSGRIARIDVITGSAATTAGVRIGDSEKRVTGLYPGHVVVAPHKYTAGHYLTVTPKAVEDSGYRMIFETDGKRVLRYRAGIRPQVEYVEGCG